MIHKVSGAPPKLVLNLENDRGVKAPVILTAPDGSTREAMSRWYHVRVDNKRRWSPATQVQVFATGHRLSNSSFQTRSIA